MICFGNVLTSRTGRCDHQNIGNKSIAADPFNAAACDATQQSNNLEEKKYVSS